MIDTSLNPRSMMRRDPVITMHGIRTFGGWQVGFANDLAFHLVPHASYNYGRFSLGQFIYPPARRKQVKHFYDWYDAQRTRYCADDPGRTFRPDIVAHSFGSYILGMALEMYPDMTVQKVILCGSILPVNYDWGQRFGANQVIQVRNDHSHSDVWVRFAHLLVPACGPSGYSGFHTPSSLVHNRSHDHFRHSDYFSQGHFRNWIEFVLAPMSRLLATRSTFYSPRHTWPPTAKQARAIDHLLFDPIPGHDEVAIPEGRSSEWLEANNDIYTILLDQFGEVQGYLCSLPLTTEAFDDVVTGRLTDPEIRSWHIASYDDDQPLDLYILSVAIAESVRKPQEGTEQSAFHRLLFAFTHNLTALAHSRGIRVRRVCARTWTEEGRRMCQALGMKPFNHDESRRPAYLLDLTRDAVPERTARLLRPLLHAYDRLQTHQSAANLMSSTEK